MSGPVPVHPAGIVHQAGTSPSPGSTVSDSGRSGDVPFADLVNSLLTETSQQQAAVGDTVRQLITGESDSIHDVVLAASKADLAFRLVMEIRNRLMSSWEEIMRMQI